MRSASRGRSGTGCVHCASRTGDESGRGIAIAVTADRERDRPHGGSRSERRRAMTCRSRTAQRGLSGRPQRIGRGGRALSTGSWDRTNRSRGRGPSVLDESQDPRPR